MESTIETNSEGMSVLKLDCGPKDGLVVRQDSSGGSLVELPITAEEAVDLIDLLELVD
jgi:hypothetical protein